MQTTGQDQKALLKKNMPPNKNETSIPFSIWETTPKAKVCCCQFGHVKPS